MIKQELAGIKTALRGIDGVLLVATAWPKNFDTLPCIIIQLASEQGVDNRDDHEYLTEIEWYVRVFSNREGISLHLASEVKTAMENLGYVRTFRHDEGAADVRQTVFRFAKTVIKEKN